MGNRKNRAKQSFLLYHDSRDLFAKLSPEDCQTLILGLFDYSMEQDVFFPPGSAVDIAFTVIRTYMDKNALKYEERCRINRQNGAKGGAPRGIRTRKRNRSRILLRLLLRRRKNGCAGTLPTTSTKFVKVISLELK